MVWTSTKTTLATAACFDVNFTGAAALDPPVLFYRVRIGHDSPRLMFDKSFLVMLNAEEVSELSMHFKFVGTPTLIGEIIVDRRRVCIF
jgi:hypothetical protein